MASPNENSIAQAFVSISDMQAVIVWYRRLLDLSVCGVDITWRNVLRRPDSGRDPNKQATPNSSQPLCFFWTAEIHAARDSHDQCRAHFLTHGPHNWRVAAASTDTSMIDNLSIVALNSGRAGVAR